MQSEMQTFEIRNAASGVSYERLSSIILKKAGSETYRPRL